MLKIRYTNQFKKDFKLMKKRNCDFSLFEFVVETLSNERKLPPKFHDHILEGNFVNTRECHISPDWLLIYTVNSDILLLELLRMGTHSDLF